MEQRTAVIFSKGGDAINPFFLGVILAPLEPPPPPLPPAIGVEERGERKGVFKSRIKRNRRLFRLRDKSFRHCFSQEVLFFNVI
ncbi:hypothetical protein CEXT_35941 [Caerostris extrusa]|uniref:Uncharacterized protein n=1 Tax=Caerostris extrusa TaxID=172846 RepID=A0AAV4MDX8_CAEEX|nr:hypothetical protein CEXT_35941 [Caerostris extrusa]